VVNRKAVESLIKAGAFDRFEERGTLLHNIDSIVGFAAKKQKELASGQTDLFGNKIEDKKSFGPQLVLTKGDGGYNLHDYLQWERELLGLYLLQHPLESYKNLFEEQTLALTELTQSMDGKRVTIGGAVETTRTITTKNGQAMAFVKLSSLDGDVELILFPSVLQQTIDLWNADAIIIAKGKVSAKDKDGNMTSDIKVIVDEARQVTLEQATAYQPTGKKVKAPQSKPKVTQQITAAKSAPNRTYIRLLTTADKEKLQQLKQLVDATEIGADEVVLIVGSGEDKQAIRLPNRVTATAELTQGLVALFGADNVK